MQPRIYWIVACAAVIFVGCNATAVNEKEQSGKEKISSNTHYNPTGEEFFLDDQELEGSGHGGGEVKDDLEQSGSGLGPDDEDGDDSQPEYNNNRIDPVQKPTNPPYIVDPHKTNDNTENFAPKRDGTDDNIGSIGGGNDPEDDEDTEDTREVLIMNPKHEDRASSFFAQPGVLAAVIGGAVVGLLCAILVVMFIVYRMRKKDEGSYALDEPRRSPAAAAYPKAGAPHHNREFYA